MQRSFLLALVLAFAVVGGSFPFGSVAVTQERPSPEQPVPSIAALVAGVSLDRLYADLYSLQNFSTRYAYSAGVVAASQYLYNAFSAVPGLQVSFQNFVYGGTAMRNVVAVLPGLDPAVRTAFVIGGHYDSISGDSDPMVLAPGADDNGSGTVAVVEAARVLSQYRFNATLVFIAFSAEELGLVGSGYYATCAAGNHADVGLYVNMDMIGYDPTNASGIDVITNVPSRWAANLFEAIVADYSIGLVTTQVLSLAANSDHASFWARGYPAIFLSESDFNVPNYHRSTDVVANVNMNLITDTTQGSVATLATLAGAHPPGPGALFLHRAAYGPTGTPGLVLYEADLNANPAVTEAAAATLRSGTEPTGEAVTLLETGPDTGIFGGSLPLGTGSGVPGELQVVAGDTVTAEYVDVSPAGTVTDTAVVDGVIPSVWNVAAVPDVDTAAIVFETDEPAEASVDYGPTTALGSTESDPRPRTQHRIELEGLQPNATYYFDVRVTDAAGQTVVANNGGAHYAFHTLTGIVARTPQTRVGYVHSQYAGNFFGANRILSGFSAFWGRTYLGAVQFDTNATPIPGGATPTDAWIDLYEEEWVYTAAGQWTVQVLNEGIDAGWTVHGYAAISGAAADFPILPVMRNADLVPGTWQSHPIPAAELGRVRDRVNTGALSIRIDGPTGPQGSIFQWASGYPPGCPGLPSEVPRLSVLYSMAGDAVGPDVAVVAANPNPTRAAPATTVTATVSDAATGDTPIAAAAFFGGADPGGGLATPMSAADGAFDSVTENATARLDVSVLPYGTYTVGVRGRDRAGNWGPATAAILYVGVWDLSPPSVTVSDAPDPSPLGGVVTITANATDDVGVAEVWLNVTEPGGATAFNVTMAPSGPDWVNASSYALPGTWSYAAWARDGSGRWGTAAGTFLVRSLAPPVISSPRALPDPAELHGAVMISATVTDDTGVASVWVRIQPPGGGVVNASMARAGDLFSLERPYGALGTHSFVIWATDLDGNWASASGSFLVRDATPPTVGAWAVPRSVRVGSTVRIVAECQDNDRVDGVTAEVWDPTGASLGVITMAYDALADEYVLEVPAARVGTYAFNITAADPSGNRVSVEGTFTALPAEGGLAEAIGWILLVVAVAVFVLFVALRRRRRKEGEPPPVPRSERNG